MVFLFLVKIKKLLPLDLKRFLRQKKIFSERKADFVSKNPLFLFDF